MIDDRKNASKNPWILKEISALRSYFKKNISSLTFPGNTIVEDTQGKFNVLKACSWRIAKAKVHNLIVNERKKK